MHIPKHSTPAYTRTHQALETLAKPNFMKFHEDMKFHENSWRFSWNFINPSFMKFHETRVDEISTSWNFMKLWRNAFFMKKVPWNISWNFMKFSWNISWNVFSEKKFHEILLNIMTSRNHFRQGRIPYFSLNTLMPSLDLSCYIKLNGYSRLTDWNVLVRLHNRIILYWIDWSLQTVVFEHCDGICWFNLSW
jgi:hypothetical protein